ncbi:UNVERIFIED_CONTAM: hypothetical protein FKN15_056680 [Acipenser sinensis]
MFLFFPRPGEIEFLEGMTIVYKSSIDLFFYVVGSANENAVILQCVTYCPPSKHPLLNIQ